MKIIKKCVGGGIIAKTVKLQIFLDPKMYLDLISECKHRKINAKNDSQMIRVVIKDFIQQIPDLEIINENLKRALEKNKVIIEKLESEIIENKTIKRKKKT